MRAPPLSGFLRLRFSGISERLGQLIPLISMNAGLPAFVGAPVLGKEAFRGNGFRSQAFADGERTQLARMNFQLGLFYQHLTY